MIASTTRSKRRVSTASFFGSPNSDNRNPSSPCAAWPRIESTRAGIRRRRGSCRIASSVIALRTPPPAAMGLTDVVRPRQPQGYTYWDYKNLAFPRDEHLGVDLLLPETLVELEQLVDFRLSDL